MNDEIIKSLIRVLPFLAILILFPILVKRKKVKTSEIFLQRPILLRKYLYWTIGFLLFVLATEMLLYRVGLLEVDAWNHPLMPSIIRIAGAVILAPIAEELIFRGVIFTQISKKIKSIHVAVLIQAIVFVLLHNFTYENTLSSNIAIVQSFVDALLFAYARVYTKSLFTSITMHITGNLIATIERFIF